METVRIFNLATGDYTGQVYACTPREAVIAAYAQSRGDLSTWDYEGRYGHLVREGKDTVACGDLTAIKRA